MAKKGRLALLAVAAVGLVAVVATSKKNGKKADDDDKRPGEDDWGVPDTYKMIDSGTYVGLTDQAQWRIYEDPEGYFAFEWRAEEKDGGGSGFPDQNEAGDALWLELQDKFGPEQMPDSGEQIPDTGEPLPMPEEERPEEEPDEPEEALPPTSTKDDWGVSTTATVVDEGTYVGEKAEASWRIYESSNGLFFYVYRSPIGGGGKRNFESQQLAGDKLFGHMERKLGEEQVS